MTGTMQTFSLLCCFALLFLPPFPVHAQSTDTFRAPETSATMAPGDAAGQLADVHDIYDPIPLSEPSPYWLYGALTVLLAAALATTLFLLIRARKRRAPVEMPDPSTQAHSALQTARTALHETNNLRRYCDDVSALLKTYVEEVTGYRISSRTTQESLQELANSGASEVFDDTTWREDLHRCLEYCDMVKFSRHSPERDNTEQIHRLAAAFIVGSRPVAEKR